MSPVDLEKKSQERVKQWLTTDLGYTFLGNLEDVNNTSVKEELLKANLKKRGYKKQLIDKATQELLRCANNQSDSLYQVNWNVYQLLRYGANIKDENGLYITVHYIDWKNIDNNDFAVAEEVSVLCSNGCNHKRPDLVIYVNGIALAIFELKRSSIIAAEGIRQLIQNQKPENIERFFSTAQFLFAGNESQGLFYGTIETPELYYLQWKEDVKAHDDLSNTIKQIQDDRDNLLRNGVVSLCQKKRFLSIIHDFIIFDAGIKKLARHNQYFANIAAHKFIRERQGGIIWNTQGSGKSLIMAWLTKWIRENISDSRVVIITDREELDDQIETLFYNVNEKIRRAKSCADLRTILNKNENSIVCSLIHKYGHNSGKDSDIKKYLDELLRDLPANFSAKGNIFAFIDECHRTNSNKLHQAVRTLMPNAVLIGFTGTPLLNKDKKTSAEIFGPYIHTYKFNEGIKDRVILDLRYEARDVDQDLSSPDRVDSWFESKTRGLTQIAKDKLKQSWTTINRLYSSKQRLEKIAADIRFDMEIKPRLKNDRGTAMLVAGSIYEACKYWEIFKEQGFNKCAVVTSYIPNERNVRTEPTDLTLESEEEYKKRIYEQILGDKSPEDYEKEAKKSFKEQPAKMKLLIVVDKLLTGFDAPSATYLYIDKSMRDHDLFQAICRVNRPDGDDKEYGYIVDYKDLFRNVEQAVKDYTSGAFDNYDQDDIQGLIKHRYDIAKAEMDGKLATLNTLLEHVPEPRRDADYRRYFLGENDEAIALREMLYSSTAALTRAFADCSDKLVSDYGYTESDVVQLRKKITEYNQLKDMIRLASCDYINLKPYESDMRFILDTYINADDPTKISQFEDMTIVELLLSCNPEQPEDVIDEIPGDEEGKSEIIENNLEFEIVRKMDANTVYYGRLSEMLQEIIRNRKNEAISYREYLKQVAELAQAILHPESENRYPDTIKQSAARRALFDYFEENADLSVDVDNAVKVAIQPGWKGNHQKQQKIKKAIYDKLLQHDYAKDKAEQEVQNIFEKLIQKQEEYNA